MLSSRRHTKIKLSMRGMLLIMMCALAFLVALTFSAAVFAAGLLPSLDDAAFRTLYNHAADNVSRLSAELTVISRAARTSADGIGEVMYAYQQRLGMPVQDMQGNVEAIDGALSASLQSIIDFMDNNAVNGAFVMLNTSYTGDGKAASLYLRDPTPSIRTTSADDYSIFRGHKRLLAGINLPLDKSWAYEQALDVDANFFTNPQEAAKQNPRADRRDWGYWTEPFRLTQDDFQVITFTTPIVDAAGETLGVFGVEFSVRYMEQIMPRDNLPFDNGFYMLGVLDNRAIDTRFPLCSSPAGLRFLMEHPNSAPFVPAAESQHYAVYETAQGTGCFLAYVSLGLYGQNSPFIGEQYHLFAIAPKDEVLKNSRDIRGGIAMSLCIAVALALVGALLLSRAFSSRIEHLVAELRGANPQRTLELSPTGIREIDELTDVIKNMSGDIIQYAARMTTIVDLVGIPLGAFEVEEEKRYIYMTDSLFRLLEIDRQEASGNMLPEGVLKNFIPGIELPTEDNAHCEVEIVRNSQKTGEEKWLRFRMLRQGKRVYATVIDITDEVRQKRWLEFERDYDPLTKLLNRNAYPSKMSALIEREPERMGVLIFGDLDNLKYINDTFGHDMGDRYICMAATALSMFEEHGGVVARISGDEFAVYIHGHGSRETLRYLVDNTMRKVRDVQMELPDGNRQKVRISIGLSYYSIDAEKIETLIRYADFAMYEIKHSVKGGTREFNRDSYEKNSFILHKPSQLDRLIEGRRLRFAFQPIIDARTGEVFAYEALMRPQMREFHTPMEVLALAKSQSKLYQIEKLTLSCAFQWLVEHEQEIAGQKLFINMIANQQLSEEDFDEIFQNPPEKRENVVMEITEGEYSGDSLVDKVAAIRKHRFGLAVDDFGTGYNNEVLLLEASPDYVKVDMSIIHNIDSDLQRQRLMRQFVDYAQANDIHLLAEGVENARELETVIRLGADYIQGFYVGRPEFELGMHNARACEEAAEYFARRNQEFAG